jgi:hypothetical protein
VTIHFREEGTPLTDDALRVVVWQAVPRVGENAALALKLDIAQSELDGNRRYR